MDRPIVGFHRDAEDHWVAALSCGHGQHVRHAPPFQVREWTLSEAGRASKLGQPLDCVSCDRRQVPDGFEPYRRTAVFTELTIPAGLTSRHTTKAGVWGHILVQSGQLEYVVHGPAPDRVVLEPDVPGIVVPEIEHEVHPQGAVEFLVEFWRRPAAS